MPERVRRLGAVLSGVSALLPDDQRRAVATAWPLAYWISPDVQAAYIAPSDPEIVETALLNPGLKRLLDVRRVVEIGRTHV